eukprot:TRINITY_DN225_c0_g1_i6.p1 TRINITY_DN225_c0_g1~~TRINITY_DN225_c0_g1_i6.p1  ORF type:complete len:506 (-),score=134.07 TRINITY_DN225_c0_g1_i6:201-1718(-)
MMKKMSKKTNNKTKKENKQQDQEEKSTLLDEEEIDLSTPRVCPTLKKTLKKLCCSERLADCHFLVKEERIPAHRFVLATESPVFEALLYPWQMTKDNKIERVLDIPTKDIVLDDIDPTLFKKVLRCVYTGKIKIESEEVQMLFLLAKRFQLDSLRCKCMSYMEDEVSADNVCDLMEQGRKVLNDPRFGLSFIEEHTPEVLASKPFLSLSSESLNVILQSNKLTADELELFQALLRWGKAQFQKQKLDEEESKNMQTVLGTLVDNIRFPLMEMSDFVSSVQSTGVLAAQDMLSLYTYWGAKSKTHSRMKWSMEPRAGVSSFKDSEILDKPELKKKMVTLYSKTENIKWERVFSAKEHGFAATNFHSKMDTETRPSLVIIKATTGNIFGGYTSKSWKPTTTSSYASDPESFLFSLVNKQNKELKLPASTSSTNHIYTNSSYGPVFGSAFNLYVCSSFNTNSNYNSYGDAFQCSQNGVTSSNYYDYFGGAYNFTVANMEIYCPKSKSS